MIIWATPLRRGNMTTSENQPIVKEFRLSDLAAEFKNHSQAEIERRQSTGADFDENLYQQAVELVLRKLGQHHPRDTQ
jgi:hypothetical protein